MFEEEVLPILAKLEGLPDIPGYNFTAARLWLQRAAQAEKVSDLLVCLDEVDAALGVRPAEAPRNLN
jgi:hypothetical protein